MHVSEYALEAVIAWCNQSLQPHVINMPHTSSSKPDGQSVAVMPRQQMISHPHAPPVAHPPPRVVEQLQQVHALHKLPLGDDVIIDQVDDAMDQS